MTWSSEQRGFVIEAFFKNAECVIATYRAFRTRFGLNPNDSIPYRKTILNWIKNLMTTGSVMPEKSTERSKSARTPENHEPFFKSPLRRTYIYVIHIYYTKQGKLTILMNLLS